MTKKLIVETDPTDLGNGRILFVIREHTASGVSGQRPVNLPGLKLSDFNPGTPFTAKKPEDKTFKGLYEFIEATTMGGCSVQAKIDYPFDKFSRVVLARVIEKPKTDLITPNDEMLNKSVKANKPNSPSEDIPNVEDAALPGNTTRPEEVKAPVVPEPEDVTDPISDSDTLKTNEIKSPSTQEPLKNNAS